MAVLFAHHDPASQAVTITAKIQANGATVALLCERAQLWRTLGKPHLAIQDYRDAVALEPKSVSMRLKLAQTCYADNELKAAFQVTEDALSMSPQPGEKASLLMLRASMYLVWKS
ncbi:MAG: hypothetical protein ABF370_17515 [Verrucomicrobiales bacterium]